MDLSERIKRDHVEKRMKMRKALASKLMTISNYIHSHQYENYLNQTEQYFLESANTRIRSAVETLDWSNTPSIEGRQT